MSLEGQEVASDGWGEVDRHEEARQQGGRLWSVSLDNDLQLYAGSRLPVSEMDQEHLPMYVHTSLTCFTGAQHLGGGTVMINYHS